MRHGLGSRVIVVLMAIVIGSIFLRLIGAVLAPVVPDVLMTDLRSAWQLLYGTIAPAMPALLALGLLGVIAWVALGWWGRR